MRNSIIAVASVMAVAVPAVARAISSANSFNGAQATASNPSTHNTIGFDVSAGQANYNAAGTSTGVDRSSYAGTPGGVSSLIQSARATSPDTQSSIEAWYSGLTAPIPTPAP